MRAAVACGVALALWAGAAAAHETWLLPQAGPAGVLRAGLTSGMAFPAPETGPKAARMAQLKATVGGAPVAATVGAEGAKALTLEVPTAGRTGLAVVSAVLSPRDIDLTPAQVVEYFAEVRPPAAIRAAWDRTTPKVWRETYVKNAKLIACVADCAADRSAMTPSGANLEFVALEPGAAPRSFRLLAGGKPAAGVAVVAVQPGRKPQTVPTDADGVVRLAPAPAGWSMLSAVWLRPPANPGQRFTSDFASVVFGGK